MSQYRAYFVPGDVDPSGQKTCNVWLNVNLSLLFKIWGPTTQLAPHEFEISGNSLTNALANIASNKLKEKAKEKLWKKFKDQLSDNLNDGLDFISKNKPKFGKGTGQAVNYLVINQWTLEPVYEVDYRVICCDPKKPSVSVETDNTSLTGGAIGSDIFEGDIHLNIAEDRQKVIDSIKNEMKGIASGKNTSLIGLRAEAQKLALKHIKKNVTCCTTPRVFEFGGLGKPEVKWGN